MIIDTHIHISHHLYDQEFPFISYSNGRFMTDAGNREKMLQMFQSAGIKACVDPAIDIESNQRILRLSEQYPDYIFPAVGVHPTRTFQYTVKSGGRSASVRRLSWRQRNRIVEYAGHPNVVAIGETGLDYHLPRKEQHRIRQKMWFVWQIRVAHEKKLPLILHIREADRDALRILRKNQRFLHGGVCHCFNGTAELAGKYVGLGFSLGIGGALLADFPGKNQLEQAVIRTPLEHILLETDGPYVKPSIPDMSKKAVKKARNTSLILPAVIARIAELKKVTPEKVEKTTTANAVRLFGFRRNDPE